MYICFGNVAWIYLQKKVIALFSSKMEKNLFIQQKTHDFVTKIYGQFK